MKCALWLALVAVVTLSVLPKRTESKQLSSDDKKRPTYSAGEDDRTDEDENAGEENFYGNSDSDVGETEKESEGEKKDDKDDDSDEESENVRKVNENQRESGIGNHRNNSEDGKDDGDSAEDEEGHSEDSKSDELLGDEDDDKEQEMPLDLILGERDYINDNFLAKEGYQYNEDGLYDDVQEEDVFSKDENEPKNEDDFHHEDEDYYDNEEEVDEEEWTGTNLRNNNQNDLKEEEENELKDRTLGAASDREESYFGTSNSVIIGVVVGAVFLAGLLIGLVFMIITYRLLAKSRGFVRLSKHDEFSSQTPIYMKASSPKCDIVSV